MPPPFGFGSMTNRRSFAERGGPASPMTLNFRYVLTAGTASTRSCELVPVLDVGASDFTCASAVGLNVGGGPEVGSRTVMYPILISSSLPSSFVATSLTLYVPGTL